MFGDISNYPILDVSKKFKWWININIEMSQSMWDFLMIILVDGDCHVDGYITPIAC